MLDVSFSLRKMSSLWSNYGLDLDIKRAPVHCCKKVSFIGRKIQLDDVPDLSTRSFSDLFYFHIRDQLYHFFQKYHISPFIDQYFRSKLISVVQHLRTLLVLQSKYKTINFDVKISFASNVKYKKLNACNNYLHLLRLNR